MIERHWKGIAHKDSAKEYVDHLLLDTFPSLESIEGYRGAAILSRNLNEGTEFLVITRWESIEVISRFAGEACDVRCCARRSKANDGSIRSACRSL